MSKIANIDRRIIYLALIVVIATALIRPVGLKIEISQDTRKVYDAINSIPEGSVVWLGFEFDAGAIPELMPAAKLVIRQGWERNLRFVCGGMWQMSGDLIKQAFDVVSKDFPDKKYGVDWVNLGYRPGLSVWLDQMTSDAYAACAGQDAYGNKFADLPLMKEFKTIKDAKFLMVFTTGTPGTPEYIKTVSGPYKIPMAAACISVEVPTTMPFISSGQLVGGILGMKGAAEYETLMKRPGSATGGMDAQSFAHALVILFILLGNIGYLREKKASK